MFPLMQKIQLPVEVGVSELQFNAIPAQEASKVVTMVDLGEADTERILLYAPSASPGDSSRRY